MSDTAEKASRAPRTNLEADIKKVCDDYVLGSITLPEGKHLTPHMIAQHVMSNRGNDAKVSGGAVAAALTRWAEIGYITIWPKPVAFIDYTDAGRNEGLSALKRSHSARRSAARAAEKAAARATGADASAPF